jgi:hypothetical protein
MGIKIFINVYIILNFITLFSYGDNKNGTLNAFEDVNEQGTIYVNQTSLLVYYVLRNQDDMSALKLNDNTSSYVDIFFYQQNDDWNSNPGFNTPTGKRVPAR